MNKITLGVIGLGGMGRWHIENLVKYPQITVIALCDVNEEVLHQVGDSLHVPIDKRFKVPVDLVYDQDVQATEIRKTVKSSMTYYMSRTAFTATSGTTLC